VIPDYLTMRLRADGLHVIAANLRAEGQTSRADVLDEVADWFTELARTAEEATLDLRAIPSADPDAAHSTADDILLSAVLPDVRDAYNDLIRRCAWWATA
jgi:hypothetical protein